MFFDRHTYAFEGSFEFSSKVHKPTTVFINKDYFYQNGYDLKLFANGKEIAEGFEVTDLLPNHVDINILNADLNGQIITIKISPSKERLVLE